MVEPFRQVLGSTAVTLIEQHDIEAPGMSLVRQSSHVVRRARSLESVEDKQGGMRFRVRLPVTMGEDTGVGRHVEVAGLRRWEPWKVPRPAPRVQRHAMPAVQTWCRNELNRDRADRRAVGIRRARFRLGRAPGRRWGRQLDRRPEASPSCGASGVDETPSTYDSISCLEGLRCRAYRRSWPVGCGPRDHRYETVQFVGSPGDPAGAR